MNDKDILNLSLPWILSNIKTSIWQNLFIDKSFCILEGILKSSLCTACSIFWKHNRYDYVFRKSKEFQTKDRYYLKFEIPWKHIWQNNMTILAFRKPINIMFLVSVHRLQHISGRTLRINQNLYNVHVHYKFTCRLLINFLLSYILKPFAKIVCPIIFISQKYGQLFLNKKMYKILTKKVHF